MANLIVLALVGALAAQGVCVQDVASLACQEELAKTAATWRQRAKDCDSERSAERIKQNPEPVRINETWEVLLYVTAALALGALAGYVVGNAP